jgi:hypothetical protein
MAGNGSGNGGYGGPGQNSNQSGSTEGGSSNTPGSPSGPDWAEFSRSIENMGATLSERLTSELGGRLDRLNQNVTDLTPEPAPVDPNAGFDFDGSTPRQLYDHMMGQFTAMMENTISSVLDSTLAPYAEQITGLRRDMVTDQGSREIDRLQAAHKDFVDWVPEMKQLAQKHPSLSITEVYGLAKSSNPEKVSTLDKKYNPPPPPPVRPFSLGPSSQGQGSGGGNAPSRMNKQEAALDAYRQVQERHPGVLAALDDAFPGL